MKPRQNALLARLAQDAGGNVLAITAASVFVIMGMVGGAVDMSRAYMVESRLQQACDAGALAARKNMAGESLTDADKNVGYRFFDFNFRTGSYGATLTSRAYTQPSNSAGTPQAIVNGAVVAAVPTTIMRVFGNEAIDLTVNCSSKMDIANADVAMVLDVTGSMDEDMKISSSSSAKEPRIAALRKAVRAFYNALGPGRAGGDLSKGRIRYAFVPYGTVVNVGYVLNHNQMVSSWNYQSREAKNETDWGWKLGNESNVNWGGGWSSAPNNLNNQSTYSNWADIATTGGNTVTVPNTNPGVNSGTHDKRKDVNETNCNNLNTQGSSPNKMLAYSDVGDVDDAVLQSTTNNPPTRAATNPQPSQQLLTYGQSDNHTTTGYKYKYYSGSTGSARCRLQRATRAYTKSRSGTSTKSITWTQYTGTHYLYGSRSINVAALKGAAGAWNSTVTVPALNRTGAVTVYDDVRLSGSFDLVDVSTGGSPQDVNVTWRGCVEERKMVNTITGATSLDTIPTGANDLNTNLLADAANDNTRWKPWLYEVVYKPNGTSRLMSSDECPAPALKLQEIGNYDTTSLTSSYPNLFRDTSANPTSYYYPYTSTLWSGTAPASERSKNTPTLRNYIDRISLVGGTLHDSGFIWGLHLVSGEGMFAGENPDRFNGFVVSRNIVFMTDGEMNPGEERYVFSGYNQYDGRLAPASTSDSGMKTIENRRLRILCEAAKRQGITVWVVAITSSSTDDFDDLRACASSSGNFKSAATSNELVASFTTIAQSIGGLRISR